MRTIDQISVLINSGKHVIIHVLIPGLFIRSLRIKRRTILGSEKLLQKSIPSLINEGENEYVEFRSSLRHDYRQGSDICVKVHVSFHWIEFKENCSLFIEPSHRPVYINEGNRTVFYLRTGTITNPLTTSETVEYLKTRNNGRPNR